MPQHLQPAGRNPRRNLGGFNCFLPFPLENIDSAIQEMIDRSQLIISIHYL